VIIDDYIPVKDGEPAYFESGYGAMWPSLLEKAWAKAHGSYE